MNTLAFPGSTLGLQIRPHFETLHRNLIYLVIDRRKLLT